MGKITVVLTGATGYLGSKFADRLIRNGYEVCVIKRASSSLSRIENQTENLSLYNNDETDIKRLFQENRVDVIVHMATSYGRKGESMLEIKAANLDFPLFLLHHALENDVKYFINTGTSLPYLTNQYALFKNQFSECLEFFADKITSVTVLLEHFYGPGDDDSKFVTAMIKKMKTNVEEIALTEGIQLRDFIFADDVLDAYLVILTSLQRLSRYNVIPLGSGEAVTIRSVVEAIKEYTQSSSTLKFGAVPMRENELMKSDADISILNSLGWYPKYSLEDGLRITVDSLKNLT